MALASRLDAATTGWVVRINCLAAVAAAVLLATALPATAGTRQVPSEYPTIQAAVNAATVGDTILVAPGIYPENVILDRRVALLSEAGPEVTTIDGQDRGPVVVVNWRVDHASIEGFRITGGNGYETYWAAGINVDVDFTTGGYATIRHNIVEHNWCPYGAGGIFSVRHSIVTDNVVQYNNETLSQGISAMEVSGTIERNIVRYNGFAGDMETVHVQATDTFAWNQIVDNPGGWYSTIVFYVGGSIHHNTIAGNGQADRTVDLRGPIAYDFHNNLVVHGNWAGLNCSLTGSHSIRCNSVWGRVQTTAGIAVGWKGSMATSPPIRSSATLSRATTG